MREDGVMTASGPTLRRSRTAAGAVAVVLVLGLTAGCSTAPDRGRRAPSPSAAPTSAPASDPTSGPGADPTGTGTSPPPLVSRDPATLAAQLRDVAAVLRLPDPDPARLGAAGELHQLVVLALATAPPRVRREVDDRLPGLLRELVDAEVRAAIDLRGLTRPQPKLPRWRIVDPPSPDELLACYRRAERRTGVPWTYLAAIHLVETRMGRIRGTSTAGARGPMQFMPGTWDLYGAGGDIEDPADAVLAAGRLLAAHGAPRDMAGALWHYNHAAAYVRAVTEYARTLERWPQVYRSYWQWRVLYRHVRGTYVLPVGYPRVRPQAVALPWSGRGRALSADRHR